MTDVTVDIDQFAAGMEQLLGHIDQDVEDALPAATKKAGQHGVKAVRAGAPVRTGRYKAGWSYKSWKKGKECVAEVGNADVPGLPHLLEKGHATLGGGRVPGKPHIAPAAVETFEVFQDAVEEAVEEALG